MRPARIGTAHNSSLLRVWLDSAGFRSKYTQTRTDRTSTQSLKQLGPSFGQSPKNGYTMKGISGDT
eukprot:10650956-Karenia_brevis.AAC.1